MEFWIIWSQHFLLDLLESISMPKQDIQQLILSPGGQVPGVLHSSLVLTNGSLGHQKMFVKVCTMQRPEIGGLLGSKLEFEKGELPMQESEKWMKYFQGALLEIQHQTVVQPGDVPRD